MEKQDDNAIKSALEREAEPYARLSSQDLNCGSCGGYPKGCEQCGITPTRAGIAKVAGTGWSTKERIITPR